MYIFWRNFIFWYNFEGYIFCGLYPCQFCFQYVAKNIFKATCEAFKSFLSLLIMVPIYIYKVWLYWNLCFTCPANVYFLHQRFNKYFSNCIREKNVYFQEQFGIIAIKNGATSKFAFFIPRYLFMFLNDLTFAKKIALLISTSWQDINTFQFNIFILIVNFD